MRDFPYRALTFDCFGTLTDWRRGQQISLQALPELQGFEDRFDALEVERMEEERRIQAGPWRAYHQILSDSIRYAVQKVLKIDLSATSCQSFSRAQADWPAFPDSADALRRLAKHCTIGLLSNCDAQPLRHAATKTLSLVSPLLVPAEAIQSYKPAAKHWQAALRLLDCEAKDVLHVSAYSFYDLVPASRLGFHLAFVQRDDEPTPADLKLAYQARDLTDLADQLGC